MKSILNKLFHSTDRISYRRLMTFVAASGLLYVGKLDGEQWVYVAIAYIAGQAAPRMAAALRA